jgi:hypothetical protein
MGMVSKKERERVALRAKTVVVAQLPMSSVSADARLTASALDSFYASGHTACSSPRPNRCSYWLWRDNLGENGRAVQ